MMLLLQKYLTIGFFLAVFFVVVTNFYLFLDLLREAREENNVKTSYMKESLDKQGVEQWKVKHKQRIQELLHLEQERKEYGNSTQNERIIKNLQKRAMAKVMVSFPMTEDTKSHILSYYNDLKVGGDVSPKELLRLSNSWITSRSITQEICPELGSVLNYLTTGKIVGASVCEKGTQLKLLLYLEGGFTAVFKPKWYDSGVVIEGPVYSGKDRHFGELAAFHIGRLLGLHRTPLVAGRKIDLDREIRPVADKKLLNTFLKVNGSTCFYGVCFYCKKSDPVCANNSILDGAIINWLPRKYKLVRQPSPWRRTYKKNARSPWEVEPDYCEIVLAERRFKEIALLLDLVDAAIFDFLISNGDRHHYEVFDGRPDSMVLLLDNGKSFGDPHRDYFDILAPLYQCCRLRKRMWNRLKIYRNGGLSLAVDKLLSDSVLAPVLTQDHLDSLDRRLLIVFAAVDYCMDSRGIENVLF